MIQRPEIKAYLKEQHERIETRLAQVAKAAAQRDTLALQALNDHIVNDPRVEVAQLTIGDGVTMVRRR